MKISTSDIQEIRQQTGLGVMDIRNALEEAGGKKDKALDILKKKAGDKMAKRAEREAKQGIVGSYAHGDGKLAVLVEVNCETDFVAKNEDFLGFVKDLTLQVASMKPENIKKLLSQDFIKDSSKKVEDLLKEIVAKTGENIVIKRFTIYSIGEDPVSC